MASAGPCTPRTVEALAELRSFGGQGDPADQPAGLVHPPRLPRLRPRLAVPGLRRLPDACTAAAPLRCHHCGHSEPKPERCPDCGSVTIARVGAGTQRVEAELAGLLEPLEVFRLDSDSAGGAGTPSCCSRFERAESGVLVGTQMVAKGHDFPEVTLGVVLDADGTPPNARLPLRGAHLRPDHPARRAQRPRRRGGPGAGAGPRARGPGDQARRRTTTRPGSWPTSSSGDATLRYPPFSHLIEVVLASPDPEPPRSRGRATCGRWSPSASSEGVDLLGPAPLFRLRGKHRRRLLLKAPERRHAVAAVRDAVEAAVRGRALSRGRGVGGRRSAVDARLDGAGPRLDRSADVRASPRSTDPAEDELATEAEAPAGLDPERLERRDAALAQVVKFGDPVLRSVASPVEEFDDALAAEVERMSL